MERGRRDPQPRSQAPCGVQIDLGLADRAARALANACAAIDTGIRVDDILWIALADGADGADILTGAATDTIGRNLV